MLSQNPELAPHLIIYLRCNPKTAFQRVQLRARGEEKRLTLDYLTKIHEQYEYWLNDRDVYLPGSFLPPETEKPFSVEPKGSLYRTSSLSEMYGGSVKVLVVNSDLDFLGVWEQAKPLMDSLTGFGSEEEMPTIAHKSTSPMLKVMRLSSMARMPKRATSNAVGYALFRYLF